MKTKLLLIILLFCIFLQSNAQQIQSVTASQENIQGVEQIQLYWQSVNEWYWCYFVIERDVNNTGNFLSYDTMMAAGTTNHTSNYGLIDFGPFQVGDTYCYRVKLIVDNPPAYCDSFAFYSDTACVNYTTSIEEQSITPFYIFPNPSNSSNININFPFVSKGDYEVLDVLGAVVAKGKITNADKIELDISTIAKGCYFVKVLQDDKCFVGKFVKE